MELDAVKLLSTSLGAADVREVEIVELGLDQVAIVAGGCFKVVGLITIDK